MEMWQILYSLFHTNLQDKVNVQEEDIKCQAKWYTSVSTFSFSLLDKWAYLFAF